MQNPADRAAGYRHLSAGRLCALFCLLVLALPTLAHTPHHVVDDLELSPDYANDTTLFVLVHNYLLRSNDRAGSWTRLVTGIDTPFVLTDVEISSQFSSDGTVFLASGGSGVFKSSDRGNTWRRFNAGLKQLDLGKLLLVNVDDESLLVAAGSSRGLFGSSATEESWVRLLSDDVQITALGMISDSDEPLIFAGDSDGGIWRSGPGVENWQRVAQLEDVGAITAFAESANPDGSAAVLVGTETAGLLHISADGTVVERQQPGWPVSSAQCDRQPNPAIRDIEVSRDGSRMYFTTWSDALYVTSADNEAYEVLDHGLRCNVQADHHSFRTPHFRNIEMSEDDSDWFLATFEGLFRSVDLGKTWVPLETMPVNLIRGMSISAADGERHDLLITTYGGGAYLTQDHGQSWTTMNHGLVTTRLADAEFVAAPDSRQVYTLARGRLLAAGRPGESWAANDLNELTWMEQLNAKIFGPVRRSIVWPMHIELSPAFADDQTMLLGFRRAGIWLSEDAGNSWIRDWDGPTDYVTDMQISPDFANDGTAFAAFRGAGIYVTRDRAATWEPANDGFDFFADHETAESPNHLVDPPLSRAITDAVLAVSPHYASDQTVFAGSAAGLYRSTNGGRHWQKLSIQPPEGIESVTGLALSPAYSADKTLLVGVKGHGIFRSTDGGESFEYISPQAGAPGIEPGFIEFSPSYPTDNTVYAATDWSLWISTDKGDSWRRVTRPARYEDWRGAYSGPVWFDGDWQRETGAGYSASTQTVTGQSGATATLKFYGTNIRWYGERGPDGGQARVTIDGKEIALVELSAGQVEDNAMVFSIGDLTAGSHEIVIGVLKGRVTIDNFDVGQ